MHPTLKMSLEEARDFLLEELSKMFSTGKEPSVMFWGLSENGENDFAAGVHPQVLFDPALLKQTWTTMGMLMDQKQSVRWIFGGYIPNSDMVFIQYGDRHTDTSINTARKVERYESGSFKGFGPEQLPQTDIVAVPPKPQLEPEISAALSQSKGATKH